MWLAICFLILPPHLPQFAFLSFASSEEVIIFTKAIQISIFHEGKGREKKVKIIRKGHFFQNKLLLYELSIIHTKKL